MNQDMIDIQPLGESAISISFGHTVSLDIHHHVRALGEYIEEHPFPGLKEYILSYTSVTLMYDIEAVLDGHDDAQSAAAVMTAYARDAVAHLDKETLPPPAVVTIPVCYGGSFGPDLEFVAQSHDMTPEEVIAIHTKNEYTVYMIGFCPGFPYLGGLDERIATPRRSSPRVTIPARSVGIAGMQTGVYPLSTPGGWQLIGRSAIELFTPDKDTPSLLKAGDLVRFKSITEKEYKQIRGDAE